MSLKEKRLEELRSIVEKEYNEGDWLLVYKNHILVVNRISLKLARKLNGDKEVLEAASLLHDIGRIKFGEEDHEIKSAEIAEEILNRLGFEKDFIEKVKICISEHRHSKDIYPTLLESKILRDADAISVIANPFWFIYLYTNYKKLDFKTAVFKFREKVEELFSILILEESKREFKKYYKSFLEIFKNFTI